jgi:phage head maturation protease
MNDLKLYADIIKVDKDKRLVYGYASTEALDSQGERISKEAVETALPDYMKWANIREMHEPSAVGVAKEAEVDEKGLYLVAKIVDDTAWNKVKEGVYKGFSVGGKKIEKIDETVTKCKITEISIVDRPANPECAFDLYKVEKETEEMNEIKSIEQAQGILAKYAGEEISDVSSALYALQSISYLYQKEMSETHPEAMEQVTQLKAAITALKNFIVSEIQEKDPNDVISLVEKIKDFKKNHTPEEVESFSISFRATWDEIFPDEPLTKIGAKIGRDNMSKVQAIHDHSVSMGAMCKAEKAEKLEKGETTDMDKEQLEKVENEKTEALAKAEALTSENETLKKRIDELEAQPVEGKGIVGAATTITKTEDNGGGNKNQELMTKVEELAKVNPEAAAQEMVKFIHSLKQ